MAFDVTNPSDLAALKDEVILDPVGVGYDVNGPTRDIVFLLNDADSNPTSATVTKPVEDLQISDVAFAIVTTEYGGLDEYYKEWVKSFIAMDEDAELAPHVSMFLKVFTNGNAPQTRAAITAARQKDASRAEELFGVNTVLTEEDWFAARDS